MKKLPKAITQTADDMRLAAGLAVTRERAGLSARPLSLVEPAEAPTVPDWTSRGSSVASTATPKVATSPSDPSAAAEAAWRHKLAHAIVERYAAYSAIGGMIPLPLVNVAGITASIVRMVKLLSAHYDVPFKQDRARSIVIGLAMGVFPTGLGAITTSSLFSVVPGANVIGMVTSSVVAAGCTRSIGRIFVEHFENGATLADFPVPESR